MKTLHLKDAPDGWQDNPEYVFIGGTSGLFASPKGASKSEHYNAMRLRIQTDAEAFDEAIALAGKTLIYRHKSLVVLARALCIEAWTMRAGYGNNRAYGVIDELQRERKREAEREAIDALKTQCAALAQKWKEHTHS